MTWVMNYNPINRVIIYVSYFEALVVIASV